MRPKPITLTAAVLDRNGISAAETLGAAGNFTIGGVLATGGVATLDIPRHIGIYAAGNESGLTITVTGTNRFGAALTEDITGPSATTVNGSKDFKTVTQVASDGATAGDVEIGTTDEFDSQVIPIDCYADKISYSVNLSSAADLTYEVKYTLDDVFLSTFTETAANWIADLGPQVADVSSASDAPIRGLRVEVTSWTSASDYIYINILTANK